MKIRKQEWVIVEVDAKIPYYYHQNLSSEHGHSDIYGKIEGHKCTTVHITKSFDGDKTIEISTSEHKSIERSGLGCYFTKEFESSGIEFDAKVDEARKFISDISEL